MKKILLGTSAVALAGASATSANAAEWDLSWGGYMNTYLNFLSLDDDPSDRDGFDVLQDGEITFSPSITLDNGLTFGVNVQFEADSFDGGDDVDEAYVTVGGSFGQVVLGSDDSAFGTMLYGAAGVGWAGVRSSTMTGTMMGGGFGARGDHAQLAGDAMRITYYTPRFAGFQLGASYARNASEDDRGFESRNTDLQDIISLGANYDQTFGNVRVRLSGIFETGDQEGSPAVAAVIVPGTPAVPAAPDAVVPGSPAAPGILRGAGGTLRTFADTTTGLANNPGATLVLPSTPAQPATTVAGSPAIPAGAPTVITPAVAAVGDSDPTNWSLGASVGFGGVTIGGAYANIDPDTGNNSDTDHFNLGVSYTTGPWGVSLSGAHTDAPGYDTNQVALNGTYDLGPGVTAGAYIGWAERDNDNSGDDPEGFVVGTGLALSF